VMGLLEGLPAAAGLGVAMHDDALPMRRAV
jgi:hypothetical protein